MKKILLVDANDSAAFFWLSHALIAEGRRVVMAADVPEALKNAADGVFDAALIDASLRGPIDGIALARRLAKLVPCMKVILLVGKVKPRLGRRVMLCKKPSSLCEIRAILHEVFAPKGRGNH